MVALRRVEKFTLDESAVGTLNNLLRIRDSVCVCRCVDGDVLMTENMETCADCGRTIHPAREEYKIRRNSDLHVWEPICMDCWRKLVMDRGGKYGDISIDENGKIKTEVKEIDQ